ncbi:MAG: nitroreductase family protein [Candidatus Bathyarchaeota archaeon]|nr:MAG: nitroreductase family protein [Candidatus Bathyarchaeota archaeon]
MEVFTAIEKRCSIRSYKTTQVGKKDLYRVLEAGRLAPSASNKQPWQFIVVTDKQVKEKLRAAYDKDWFVSAPVIIIGCAVPEEAWKRMDGQEYWMVDVAIAIQNMILAATELGLGTCWIADFDEEAIRKAVKLPSNIRVVAMTPLGHPADEKGPRKSRKPLAEIVRHEHW